MFTAINFVEGTKFLSLVVLKKTVSALEKKKRKTVLFTDDPPNPFFRYHFFSISFRALLCSRKKFVLENVSIIFIFFENSTFTFLYWMVLELPKIPIFDRSLNYYVLFGLARRHKFSRKCSQWISDQIWMGSSGHFRLEWLSDLTSKSHDFWHRTIVSVIAKPI